MIKIKAIFLSTLFVFFANFCYSQDGVHHIPVYLEKLRVGFDFNSVGDSITYDNFCINPDSCYIKITCKLLDTVGSYEMKCFNLDNSYIYFLYRGQKSRYKFIEKSSFNEDGIVIKREKSKMFNPLLLSSVFYER